MLLLVSWMEATFTKSSWACVGINGPSLSQQPLFLGASPSWPARNSHKKDDGIQIAWKRWQFNFGSRQGLLVTTNGVRTASRRTAEPGSNDHLSPATAKRERKFDRSWQSRDVYYTKNPLLSGVFIHFFVVLHECIHIESQQKNGNNSHSIVVS